MARSVADKRSAFRALHEKGCFVLPNPWDVGGARLMQRLGFSAIASTSSGYAWSTGRADNAVTLGDVLEHLALIAGATDLPLNADFESGFAEEPEGVAANVARAIETGVSGLSIEDRDGTPTGLYGKAVSVERVRAARKAIDASGEDVILVARTEGLLINPQALAPAIDKLALFAEAGADCLYAPGVRDKADIAAMVRAVAPKPVNVLALDMGMKLADYADLGVRRVSVGGALARVGWAAVIDAAERLKAGSFAGLEHAVAGRRMNEMFGRD